MTILRSFMALTLSPLLNFSEIYASEKGIAGASIDSPSPASSSPASSSSKAQSSFHITIEDVKSPKGLKAWLVRNTDIPVVTVSMAFRNAGDKNDPKGKSGLVDLLADALQEGAGDLDSRAFHRKLLEKNIELSVRGTQDVLRISFRTIRENVAEALQLIQTMLTQPHFEKEALERVKNQLMTYMAQDMHSENKVAEIKLSQLLYPNHPYSTSIEDTLRELPSITADDLRTFMKDRLTQDQLILSAAGDISAEDFAKCIDDALGALPAKGKASVIEDIEPKNLGKTIMEPMPIPQSMIRFVQTGLPRNHPDFYTAYVIMEILGNGAFESRLWEQIREKRGLAYGVDASLFWNQHTHVISGSTATQNKNVQQVIEIIRQEWQLMKNKGPTQEELDFVKKQMIGSFALRFSSTRNIAESLIHYQIDHLDREFINQRNELIQAVTLADVQRVAQQILKPEELTFVVVGGAVPDISTATSLASTPISKKES